MRADRLLSLLILLQTRGPLTARRLAAELEVCERTIYRDIDALSLAGVPVYGEPGPAGGYALLDSYRTTLTGLNEHELRALFMLNISSPLEKLGIGAELRGALLKLSASLPDSRRSAQDRVRARFYIDANWWQQGQDPVPHLPLLHRAVWEDRRVKLTYALQFEAVMSREASPYGLVAKGGVWYLVSERGGKYEVRRVDALLDVCLTERVFERDPTFDLEAYWKAWCLESEDTSTHYPVCFKIAPRGMQRYLRVFGRAGQQALESSQPDAAGWKTIELSFPSLEAARDQLLSFGSSVEILSPLALRLSLQDVAEQVAAVYRK
jgi:predicted DNA-binding transcriptional regulator YafY